MENVLQFDLGRARPNKARLAPAETAEVIFFPGVRVEDLNAKQESKRSPSAAVTLSKLMEN